MAVNFDLVLFRQQFPELTVDKYPDALVLMYADMASEFISEDGCPCSMLGSGGSLLALNYMTAHLMTLAAQNAATAAAGGVAGGYAIGATIGEVEVINFQPPAKDGWQFFLVQTPYGQALWGLLELKSVGGCSVGGLGERAGFRKVGGVFL